MSNSMDRINWWDAIDGNKLNDALQEITVENVKRLLDSGADISTVNNDGFTLLHLAFLKGDKDIIELVIPADRSYEKGINPTDHRGFSHFHAACMRNNPAVVKAFLQNGVDVDAKVHNHQSKPVRNCLLIPSYLWEDQTTVPFYPHYNGSKKDTNLDLSTNSPKWSQNYTALHFAVENKCADVVELLINHGANVMATTKLGLKPLHLAAIHFDERIMSMLIESGVGVDIRCQERWPPLFYAICHGHVDAIKLLLKRGADWYANYGNGYSVWNGICSCGYEEVRLFYFNTVPEEFLRSDRGTALLREVVSLFRLDLVKILMNRKVQVNFSIRVNDLSPLHAIVKEMYFPSPWKRDANYRDENGITYARLIIQLLLKNGADVNARTPTQQTPLHVAVMLPPRTPHPTPDMRTFDYSYFEDFMNYGCDINARDCTGRTPLHVAVRQWNLKAVEMLIRLGADINVQDNEGETPVAYSLGDGPPKLLTMQFNGKEFEKDVKPRIHLMAAENIVDVLEPYTERLLSDSRKLFSIFSNHVLKLRLLNADVSEINKKYFPDFLWKNSHLAELKKCCEGEIEKLKKIHLTDDSASSKFTLYDIVVSSRAYFPSVNVEAVTILMESSSFEAKFPLCSYLIISRIKMFLVRRAALEARSFFKNLGLPDLCSSMIIALLSEEDINKLNSIVKDYS